MDILIVIGYDNASSNAEYRTFGINPILEQINLSNN